MIPSLIPSSIFKEVLVTLILQNLKAQECNYVYPHTFKDGYHHIQISHDIAAATSLAVRCLFLIAVYNGVILRDLIS